MCFIGHYHYYNWATSFIILATGLWSGWFQWCSAYDANCHRIDGDASSCESSDEGNFFLKQQQQFCFTKDTNWVNKTRICVFFGSNVCSGKVCISTNKQIICNLRYFKYLKFRKFFFQTKRVVGFVLLWGIKP